MGSRSFNYAKSYARAHENAKWFTGRLDPEGVDAIAQLVHLTRARRLLDYGCGKGFQYLADRIHDRWGGILPHCYDIGVKRISTLPGGLFDGVICTDVLEHIAEEDVDAVLDEIFGKLETTRPVFAYFNIFCNLAGKSFPDGKNVHLCVRPPEWWRVKLENYERGGLTIWGDYEYHRREYLQQRRVGDDGPEDGGDVLEVLAEGG